MSPLTGLLLIGTMVMLGTIIAYNYQQRNAPMIVGRASKNYWVQLDNRRGDTDDK